MNHERTIREFFEIVWNQRRFAEAGRYYAADYLEHAPVLPDQAPGLEGAIQVFTDFVAAFPDLHMALEDVIADGEVVVARVRGRGTNTGSLNGIPPTGKSATVEGIEWLRFSGGKVVERWGMYDLFGLRRQLGLPD